MTGRTMVVDVVGLESPHVAYPVSITAFDPATDRLPENLVHYRARGGVVFVFTPVRLPNGRFRAYIRSQPFDYRGRDDDSHASYRLADRHGDFVCWTPEPASAAELLKVMRIWAEATLHYIASGQFRMPR